MKHKFSDVMQYNEHYRLWSNFIFIIQAAQIQMALKSVNCAFIEFISNII